MSWCHSKHNPNVDRRGPVAHSTRRSPGTTLDATIPRFLLPGSIHVSSKNCTHTKSAPGPRLPSKYVSRGFHPHLQSHQQFQGVFHRLLVRSFHPRHHHVYSFRPGQPFLPFASHVRFCFPSSTHHVRWARPRRPCVGPGVWPRTAAVGTPLVRILRVGARLGSVQLATCTSNAANDVSSCKCVVHTTCHDHDDGTTWSHTFVDTTAHCRRGSLGDCLSQAMR